MSSGIQLIIILFTFFFAAFSVASEFALVQTRLSSLEDDKANGNGNKKKLDRQIYMVTHLNDYLSTTQVGVSLAGIILGWIGEPFIDGLLSDVLKLVNLGETSSRGISVIIGVGLLTYLEVVFTEVVPKNLSTDKPRQMLDIVAGPLHYLHTLFYPFVWLLNISAGAVVKMMGIKMADENDDSYSQNEILMLSRNAVQSGELEKNDYLYMQRAFDLNDKVARDIMVDRTQLVVLDIDSSVKDGLRLYLQKRFSRIPVVANGDKDRILGYVYNYDLVRQSRVDSSIGIDRMLRDITTTSETTPITEVLQQMIKNRAPIVVVVDEYGGTSGIITDKDIYEELFGTVRDEIDPATNEFIFKQPKGTYQVNGKLTTYDFERYFNTDIKAFDKSDIVTIAGFIIDNYDDLKVGKVIKIMNFEFKVLDYENSFINWFEVTNLNEAKPTIQKSTLDQVKRGQKEQSENK
ncbi:hemolysin family protein [Nicoliella spurrieriana]|uniref:Hemolysin family protein n=1 Tax=Nicoliella spurrieriana TaxID=2925830 RepID=A0A976RSV2_9LACO|nr:hemolysin family protein [Nicoliella spurrieriana]UQS87175.1 hemolysin family protein [Nicoliella spurrieriana]